MCEKDLQRIADQLEREAAWLAKRYPAPLPVRSNLTVRPSGRNRIRAITVAASLLLAMGLGISILPTIQPARPVGDPVVSHTEFGAEDGTESNTEATELPVVIPLSWEIAVTVPDGKGGRETVARGYYFPPEVQAIEFEDLSYAERYAVRQTLAEAESLGPEI